MPVVSVHRQRRSPREARRRSSLAKVAVEWPSIRMPVTRVCLPTMARTVRRLALPPSVAGVVLHPAVTRTTVVRVALRKWRPVSDMRLVSAPQDKETTADRAAEPAVTAVAVVVVPAQLDRTHLATAVVPVEPDRPARFPGQRSSTPVAVAVVRRRGAPRAPVATVVAVPASSEQTPVTMVRRTPAVAVVRVDTTR